MAYDENQLVKLSALKQLAEKVRDIQNASVLGVNVNGTPAPVADDRTVNVTIAEGSANGTLSVNGADVPVHGLGALAYKSEVGTDAFSEAFRTAFDNKAEQSALNALIGADTEKSVRKIAAEELAAQLIPQDAKESLDTLREIAAWIQEHPDEAAALNAKLTLGEREVDGELKEYDNVREYVEDVTSGLVKTSEIATDAEVSELLTEVFGAAS